MARNFMCTKTDPVVETKAGKLRGFQLDGTYAFHGVNMPMQSVSTSRPR